MTERPALPAAVGRHGAAADRGTARRRRARLRTLAREITAAHLAGHPEVLERYGPAVRDRCTNDNQHLLSWAAHDVAGKVDFDAQLSWLAGVLSARGYPLESLADNLRTAAAVLERRPGVGAHAGRLTAAAAFVGSR